MPATTHDERSIASVAEEVLKVFSLWELPVEPLVIAAQEQIVVNSGRFGAGFDGRIRCLLPEKLFSLIYQESGPGRPPGRVNFTIGHELGHYYMHRDYLLQGRSHSSTADFRSRRQMEVEADQFAASLLMPRELFVAEVKSFRRGCCDLEDFCVLAGQLGTSVTSTIRRYCQTGVEPALAVFSVQGFVRWTCRSEDMEGLGMGFVRHGSPLPPGSLSASARGDEIIGRDVDADVWFDWPRYSGKLWEETMSLGNTGVRVTYLTPSENPWSD